MEWNTLQQKWQHPVIRRFILSGLPLLFCSHICITPSSYTWVVSKVQNTGTANQSPTLLRQLIIVIITNHGKYNFVSDIGQNDTAAINFVTAVWQNRSRNFQQKVATQQSTLTQLSGRTEVKQLIATQQSASSQLSGRTELIVADNGLPTVLEKLLWPCCCRYRKNGSLWT